MQPDLDRLLRESRAALPNPAPVTARSRIDQLVSRVVPHHPRRYVGLSSAIIVGLLATSLAVAAERIVEREDARPVAIASRIIDKTLVCTTQYGAVTAVASPRGEYFFVLTRVSPGYLGVGSGPSSVQNPLVYVRARREQSRPQGVYARAGRCFLSRKTVTLAARGLAGPPVQWTKNYSCPARGRIVVRVRAVLPAAVTWRRIDDSFWGARTNVVSAQLAIRSDRTGKPIAYSTLDSAGRTRLWSAANCA